MVVRLTRVGAAVPPWVPMITAMLSVQIGSALSVGLSEELGTSGASWLRLSLAALIFCAIARPPLRAIRRSDVASLVGLGVATGVMTISFLAAITRIPLGTAVAISFLGPLVVSVLRARTPIAFLWPGLALVGVGFLTEPWTGLVDATGVACAAVSAACWGVYILLTQRVGDRFIGLGSLSITIAIGALAAAIPGIPQAAGHITPAAVATAFGLAILLPVLPYALELVALRRMTPAAFGTFMAIEPAIGVAIGLLALGQRPSPAQGIGIALVVGAGMASQRRGRRLVATTA